jgi:hypothetical protein
MKISVSKNSRSIPQKKWEKKYQHRMGELSHD